MPPTSASWRHDCCSQATSPWACPPHPIARSGLKGDWSDELFTVQNHRLCRGVLSRLPRGAHMATQLPGKTGTRLSKPPAADATKKRKRTGVSQERRAPAVCFLEGPLLRLLFFLHLPLSSLPFTRLCSPQDGDLSFSCPPSR